MEQKRKLMQTIGVAVKNLNRLGDIIPVVRNLGKRHAGYGVQDQHYDTVAAALLWTLEQDLGDLFTSEVNDAWTATCAVLAGTMKDAAAEVAGG
jgi:hemoglobin-like flavoprotein